MASCGGVGGSGNSGNSNSVGGSGGSGAASSVGGNSADSGKTSSASSNTASNETAKANNTEAANAKNGIDREAQQKSDLNGKMDAAKTDAKTEQAKTEQAKTDVKAEAAKAEQTKAEKAKAEKAKADQAQTQSLTETVKEKAKEMMAKAAEMAQTVKTEFNKALDKVQKQKELAELARNPKVGAMLDTIGFTEGTGLNYGKVVNGTVIGQNRKDMPYDQTLTAGMKNVTTLDMSQHPNVAVNWAKGQKPSSAAGRYQMLSGTWNELSTKLGLTNFHATTQDLAAVQLMKERNMIEPLLNGDLATAVTRGASTWASLPKADGKGAYKGQNARSFEAIERAYNDFLHEREWQSQINDFN